MKRSIDVIVNPTAGGGRASRVVGDIARELMRVGFTVDVHHTKGPGHAGELVKDLVKSNSPLIGIMGGDGSLNEAIAGLHDGTGKLTAPSTTTLAIIPAGTGGDFRKTLRVPEDPEGIAAYIAKAEAVPLDLGVVKYIGNDGHPAVRLFGNIASCGVSGLADGLVPKSSRFIGGKAKYFIAAFRASLRYRNVPVRVFVDDQLFYEGPILNLVVANGKAYGGGMFVAPNANPHDGRFDVVVLGNLSFVESALLSRYLYQGTHLNRPHITHTTGTVIRAEKITDADGLLDIDGETPGRLNAEFSILPAAVQILKRP